MSVKLTNVTQQYASSNAPLYNGFSAEFEANKVHVILGASGSGKTTLLNIIAKTCPCEGVVERENASYIFQSPRLINNITVKNNLLLVLNSLVKNKAEKERTVEKIMRIAEIEQYSNKFPYELSGGERQRVSIARAFVYPSQILLMDEPFNSLDYGVKARLFDQFLTLNEQSPRTVLFVTHDADEALSLADEIYILGNRPVSLTHFATLNDDKRSRDIYSEKYVKLKKQIIEIMQQTNV